MVNTPHLNLPLLSGAQAQKHVTVNEALTLVDAASNLTLLTNLGVTPPANPADGDAYVVPTNAEGAWSGADGQVAVFSNGGWLFLQPKSGWSAFDADTFTSCVYSGNAWVAPALAASPGGAGFGLGVAETDHQITPGSTNLTAAIIPSHTMVVGVTARITGQLTGGLSGWRLGVSGSDNRYGSGLGLDLNSYARGLTGAPVTYWSDTELLLTGEGGDFAGGQLRLAVHYLSIQPPSEV